MQEVRSVQVRPKTLIMVPKLTKKRMSTTQTQKESVFTGVNVTPLFIAGCSTNTA